MAKEKKNHNILERNKFFATTGIGGFGLIQSSNSKVETVIWYIVISVFSAITLRNILVLIFEYNNQKPIATVSLEKWDAYINDIYISYPIMLPGLYEEFYDDNDYPFNNSSLSSDFEQVLRNLNTKESIIGENATWPYLLISLMARYTIVMKSFERFVDINQTAKIGFKEEVYQHKLGPFINKFLHHSDQFNITNIELIEKWFTLVIKMTFRIFNIERQQLYNLRFTTFELQFSRKHRPAVYRIGFQLTEKMLLKRSDHWILNYKDIIKYLNESGVFNSANGSRYLDVDQWFMKRLGTTQGRVERGAPFVLYPDYLSFQKWNNELIKVYFGQETRREAKTIYSFHSINPNCSKTITKSQCFLECRSNLIIRNCNCIPRTEYSANTIFPENVAPCSMETYERCTVAIDDKKEIAKCINSCPLLCHQTVLSFDRSIFDRQFKSNHISVIRFWPVFTHHPVFQETYRQSDAQFWAALGGAFDFWIGISIISTVHLVVYLVKQLSYAFKKNTKTGMNIREMFHGFTSAQMVTALTLGMAQRAQVEDNERDDSNNDQKIANLTEKVDSLTQKVETIAQQMEMLLRKQNT